MSEPMASKKAAVEDVLNALALTSCRDVRIGNPLLKGISGGQAKRTNIGIALITNPRVIFLDGAFCGHTATRMRCWQAHALTRACAAALQSRRPGWTATPPMK